jgi:hypothetical protein
MDMVDVQVSGPDGGLLASARHAVPFTIGRGSNATIRFDTDREDISRIHVEVRSEGGRLVAYDRSRNGTIHRGKRMDPTAPAALADVDTLSIAEFQVKLTKAPSLAAVPVSFVAKVRTRAAHDHPFSLGPTMLAIVDKGGSVAGAAIQPTDAESAAQGYRAAGQTPLAMVWAAGGAAHILITPEIGALKVAINRAPQRPGTMTLAPLDVVRIADLRIEIHEPGKKAIECVNAECQLLNPYDPDVNCRWCGFKLQEGVTRIGAR